MALHRYNAPVAVLHAELRVTQASINVPGVNEFTRLEKIIEQLDKLLNVLLLNWQNFNL